MKKLLISLCVALLMLTASANAKKLSELEQLYDLDRGFVGIIYDKKDDKIYLKVDNLDQEFIYLSSLPAGLGSNDIGLDRGKQSGSRLVTFERVGNKVFLKQKPTNFRSDSSNKQEVKAFDEAFASSILWGFPVVDSDQDWVLLDASEFILQDIEGVARILEEQKQGSNYKVDPSRSAVYMPRTTSFPDNTELEATITLVGNKPGKYLKEVAADPYSITLRMHHSFVRLPSIGYKPRKSYPKSGFWSLNYQDYAKPFNSEITQRFIGRYRLEKKNPQAELSEAVKPIVYYVDNGAPEAIRNALMEGALWWNDAFSELGYKNAFQVKLLPANVDPMDVRYNVIQWVHRATRGWSYGNSVIDPRTGEIIKGHVTLGSLRVRQDYLIAQALMSPFAQNEDDKALVELALARVRQLSAHEVGHTLGLNHNFAASHYGKQSVMDYPHPQFQLQGNKVIAPKPYEVGLGLWDKAAIAYGYRDFQKDKEDAWLKQLIAENDLKGLLYISDPDARDSGSPHAYASLWDNGSDAVQELQSVNQIRQVALKNFGAKSLKQGQAWSDLEEILMPVYYFHRYQITAVAKWLGGLTYDYSIKRDNQIKKVEIVSGENQTRALQALLATLLPEFLMLPPELANGILPKASGHSRSRESIEGKTGAAFDAISLAEASAQHTLSLILNPQRLARLIEQSASSATIPSIDSIYTDIHQMIIEQTYEGIQASIHQSVVNLIYSNYLNLLHDKNVSDQVKMQVFGLLLKEKDYLLRKLTAVRRTSSYYGFYAYQSKRLENISINNEDKLIELPKMPPGSPI